MQSRSYERLKKTARCEFLLSYERLIELLDESGNCPGQLCGYLMKDDLRKQALANWRKLSSMAANLISDEARYDKLLRAADHMERSGLISSDEWRKLVQRAGTSFARSAECMAGTGQK
jgi:hypothetical protein